MLNKRNKGFTLLELIVVICVIGILSLVALERLQTTREQAEKVAMEQTVGILRSAMHLQMADLIARQAAQEIPRLAGQNPMNWLAEKPGNYLGEMHNPKLEDIPRGSWYFDPADRTLVYVVEHGNYFVPDSAGKKRIRFAVSVVSEPPPKDSAGQADIIRTDGVKLAAIEPYRWFK